MEKECFYGLMEEDMKGNIRMMLNKDSVKLNGQMVKLMKDNGKEVNKMELVGIEISKDFGDKASGPKAKE